MLDGKTCCLVTCILSFLFVCFFVIEQYSEVACLFTKSIYFLYNSGRKAFWIFMKYFILSPKHVHADKFLITTLCYNSFV